MRKLFATFTILSLGLSACSSPEVTLVTQEPTFDKYGNSECVDGYVLSVEGQYIDLCIPEDECTEDEYYNTSTEECLPYYKDDDDDGDDRDEYSYNVVGGSG